MVATAPIEFRDDIFPLRPWHWLVDAREPIDPKKRYSRMTLMGLAIAQECAEAFARTAARVSDARRERDA